MIGGMVVMAAVFGTVLYFGNNMLATESEKLAELKLEEDILEEEQVSLTRAGQDIEQYEDLEEIAKSVVPQDKDQARAVREIVKIAGRSGIKLNSITFPSSNLGTGGPPAAAKQPSDDGAEEPAASTPAPPPISQAVPVAGIPGVYSLEMNIVPDSSTNVTYYQFLDFLERLEKNRRTAQVTSVVITPSSYDKENPVVDFSLTINIFVKP